MSGEKTEKPTAQRKKEARREGRVPRTPDLGSWGGLLAATTVLPMLVRNTMTTSQHLLLQAIGIISDLAPDLNMPPPTNSVFVFALPENRK